MYKGLEVEKGWVLWSICGSWSWSWTNVSYSFFVIVVLAIE